MKRWVVVLVACSLALVAACSGDDGRSSDSSSDDTSSDTGDDSGGARTEFGSLDFPCGPQDGGGELPAGDPEDTFGISDAGIKVGTFSDPGFEGLPGLNQEMFDASEAFVAECNEAGGINGRPIDLTLRDAAVLQYAPRVEEACGSDFAVVGGGAVLDDSGAQALTDCGMVSVPGYAVTVTASYADNVVQPLPNVVYTQPTYHLQKLIEELDADGAGTGLETDDVIKNAGIMWGDLQTTADVAEWSKEVAEAQGFEFVYEAPYNINGEANWAPFAQAIADAGVEWFYFVGSPPFLIQLQEAMDQLGSAPAIIMQETNFYDEEYSIGIQGLNPDTVQLVRTVFWPIEAGGNPAIDAYLEVMEKHLPDAEPAQLGMQSMSAWLLFAQAAAECDRNNDLSRSCVYDTAKAVDSWDAGGIHDDASPADFLAPECGLLLEVADNEFNLWRAEGETPDDAYYCPDEPYFDVTGDFGEGVTRGGG
jgi:hypothetical protein